MTKVQSIYLSLLRAAIWGEHSALSNQTQSAPLLSPDFSEQSAIALLRLCLIQGTAPLVYNQILKLPASQTPGLTDEMRLQMKQVCVSNMMSQQRLQAILTKTWSALEHPSQGEPIHPVLLKGFGLAQLYPRPDLRAWGDLDVYVGPSQYHRGAELLRAAFPEAKHHDEEWEELKHYNFVLPTGDSIEMHRVTIAFASRRDQAYFQHLEDEAMCLSATPLQIGDVTCALPEPRFNLLFVFLHAWNHFVGEGVGFKQLCDVALLAKYTIANSNSDNQQSLSAYLKRHLTRLHLYEPWQLMGYVLIHTLELSPSEWLLYHETSHVRKYGERLITRILEEGQSREEWRSAHSQNYRHTNRYEARDQAMKMNVLARKWLTLKSRIASSREIAPYCPRYARYIAYAEIMKGLRRTLRGEKMNVMY